MTALLWWSLTISVIFIFSHDCGLSSYRAWDESTESIPWRFFFFCLQLIVYKNLFCRIYRLMSNTPKIKLQYRAQPYQIHSLHNVLLNLTKEFSKKKIYYLYNTIIFIHFVILQKKKSKTIYKEEREDMPWAPPSQARRVSVSLRCRCWKKSSILANFFYYYTLYYI